jgi:hypothetical protein
MSNHTSNNASQLSTLLDSYKNRISGPRSVALHKVVVSKAQQPSQNSDP